MKDRLIERAGESGIMATDTACTVVTRRLVSKLEANLFEFSRGSIVCAAPREQAHSDCRHRAAGKGGGDWTEQNLVDEFRIAWLCPLRAVTLPGYRG